MSVISYESLLQEDGVHADPYVLATLTRALLSANSGAAVSSLIVKATSGLLFGFTASSSLAGGQFIHLYDQNTVPSNGAVPLVVFTVPTVSVAAVSYIPPRAFRNGIVICNSTTQNTLTLGAANTIFDVQFL